MRLKVKVTNHHYFLTKLIILPFAHKSWELDMSMEKSELPHLFYKIVSHFTSDGIFYDCHTFIFFVMLILFIWKTTIFRFIFITLIFLIVFINNMLKYELQT